MWTWTILVFNTSWKHRDDIVFNFARPLAMVVHNQIKAEVAICKIDGLFVGDAFSISGRVDIRSLQIVSN